MNNKKIGNGFEQELCDILYEHGFWVHNMVMNNSGQPADVIAVKNNRAYLIDAKVCSNDNFPFSRIEENQALAIGLWTACGNGTGWFALKTSEGIYMLSYYAMLAYKRKQSSLNFADIVNLGLPIEKWVTKCK
jgi:Holliday junction resolvase